MEKGNRAIDQTLSDFMNVTAKSTVAVIIPLFGFYDDVPDNQVNGEVLAVTLARLYSNIHHLYLIFVAHPDSLPNDKTDPHSVSNILAGQTKGDNAKFLPVDRNAPYSRYIADGLDYALHETNAQFMVVFNPWVMIQDGAIDQLIDRANRADSARAISGFDLRSTIDPEGFDHFKSNAPYEEEDLSFDFFAIPRYLAEMVEIDAEYKTHVFLQRDLWQQILIKNFYSVTSDRIPIFPFDFPWSDYETTEEFEFDRAKFSSKWRFDPGLVFEDPGGKTRRDKTGAR